MKSDSNPFAQSTDRIGFALHSLRQNINNAQGEIGHSPAEESILDALRDVETILTQIRVKLA